MTGPGDGLDARAAEVLGALAELAADDLPARGGDTAYVFDPQMAEVDRVALRAYGLLAHVNGLDTTRFPSIARIENDLVAAVAGQLGGDDSTVGTVTSGGTESILLAALGARERWRATRRVGTPRIVVPNTIHAAFYKAAHLFGMEIVTVPVDPKTLRADPARMTAAIGPLTALVAVSAPSYAYGAVDPIREIAAAAARWDVPCHVDACIGGWILPFLPDAPEFDFRIPGVTSISVDLHKYGYVPKGVSLLLHREAQMRLQHWYTLADWAGYPLVNPTIVSSRPAGPMASAWAVQRYLGVEGYTRLARTAHDGARRLAAGIDRIPGLRTVGAVDTTVVAFTDDRGPSDPDIRVVVDEVSARGRHLLMQPAVGPIPPTAHAAITPAGAAGIDDLLAVIAESAEAARAHGRVAADPDLVAAAEKIDVDALTEEQIGFLLALAGVGPVPGEQGPAAGEDPAEDTALPARMAPVHALVGALPPALTERLLAALLSRRLTPRGGDGWDGAEEGTDP